MNNLELKGIIDDCRPKHGGQGNSACVSPPTHAHCAAIGKHMFCVPKQFLTQVKMNTFGIHPNSKHSNIYNNTFKTFGKKSRANIEPVFKNNLD